MIVDVIADIIGSIVVGLIPSPRSNLFGFLVFIFVVIGLAIAVWLIASSGS